MALKYNCRPVKIQFVRWPAEVHVPRSATEAMPYTHSRIAHIVARIVMVAAMLGVAIAAQAGLESERLEAFKTRLGTSAWARAELEIESEYYRNLDLWHGRDDALAFAKFKLTPELLIKPVEGLDIHLEARLESKQVLLDRADYESESNRVSLRSAYLLYEPSPTGPWHFQVGRKRFRDDREWLFDEHLDTLRVRWGNSRIDGELSISSVLIDADEDITHLMAFGEYKADWGTFGLFAINSREQHGAANPTWLGVRARAKPTASLSGYLDAAWRRGNDDETRLRGHGLDMGATWTFAAPWRPSITLAYAYGSGDANSRDNRDGTFRQTGMQDNNDRIAGVESFQYYGTLLDPELSNIEIMTIGFGARPNKNVSVELVWHGYQRNVVEARTRTALATDPEGGSQELGHALELLLGYRAKSLRCSLALGRFQPGQAFRNRDGVFGLAAEFRYMF